MPQLDISAERGKVLFITNPAGARLFINGKAIGSTPLLHPLPDGSYHIRITRQRYHSTNFYLDIQNDNIAAVQVFLEPQTGMVAPVISPQDAVVTINNVHIQNFPIELPVGTYTLRVSRFGYESTAAEVQVKQAERVQPKIKLEPRPFAVEDLSVFPKKIQIVPPLPQRELVIKGSVSAPGSIKITIRTSEDKLFSTELIELPNSPSFEKRYRLPPGTYRIIVQGKAHENMEPTVYEQRVRVIQEEPISLFTTSLPATIAAIGVPRARTVSPEIVQSSFSFGGGGRIEASPVIFPAQLSVVAGLPYSLEFQTSTGLLIEKNRTTMWSGSAQLKRGVFKTGNRARFSGAFELFGNYLPDREISDAPAALLPCETAVGSRPIFEFTLHPSIDRFMGVSLSPSVEFQVNENSGERWMGRLHGGAFLQIEDKAVALTAKTSTELHHFGYGIEFSWLIPRSSMHLNLFAGGISEEELLSYYTSGITFYYIR
ncbi:MAG: PEGA domain-containing protein [Spirochaetaceae bacterium]|nr:PEGA domain-containing protein [Spirochaetaceae bacterium]MCF7947030.1 PEGA domain-containing protein [Spirochaetia bacterium]MCF7950237.1 PEGA domain-containing protein [Spirochaetaceae bacterium]